MSDRPGAAAVGEAADNARPFGRLRPQTADIPARDPIRADVVTPVDSAKTFSGPNGAVYDEGWRLMEWRGRRASWNWSAAATLGGWLAYRRMYGYAVVHAGWLCALLAMAINGLPLRLVAILQLGAAIGLGLYGNLLYQQRFRRASWRVAQFDGDHQARLRRLAQAGGVDRRAVWIYVGGVVLAAAGLLTAGQLLGGLRFSY